VAAEPRPQAMHALAQAVAAYASLLKAISWNAARHAHGCGKVHGPW
jgi:hypothetical protein